MRLTLLNALLVLSTGAMIAATGSPDAMAASPTTTTQCISVSGRDNPVQCLVPASRLDRDEYICTCPAGGLRVKVAVCGKGQKPPAGNLALDRVRREAARDGSLLGDTVEGRAICVAPRLRQPGAAS